MKLLLLSSALILGITGCAGIDGFRQGGVLVETPWARATAGRTATGVVYVRLRNLGAAPERLISIATPVAAEAAVHETTREHGMMSMRRVNSVELPADGVVLLKPGGLHIMLMRLRAPLEEGETFPMTLTFKRAGPVTIQVEVRAVGAISPHAHE